MTRKSSLSAHYPTAGDVEARNTLVEESLGLVVHIASRIGRGHKGTDQFENLVSAGNLGLLKAASDFNPTLGHAFSTFASPRIQGAILDELRTQDPISRGRRKTAKAMNAAERTVRCKVQRAPSAMEVATEMGVDRETYWGLKLDLDFDTSTSLDASLQGQFSVEERVAAPDDILSFIESEERIALIREVLPSLTEQERTIITLYYYEDLNLKQIGTIMGVTESRISQVRTGALKKLRLAVVNDGSIGVAA